MLNPPFPEPILQKDWGIGDYALIGNCQTAALVNPHGGIDWLCWPEFDSPSLFASLLDRQHGGHFTVQPAIPFHVQRSYHADSAILTTSFLTDRGEVTVTDFFLIAREANAAFYDFTSLHSTRLLARLCQASPGSDVPMRLFAHAAPDYGRRSPQWRRLPGKFSSFSTHGCGLSATFPLSVQDNLLHGQFDVRPGHAHAALLHDPNRPVSADIKTVLKWRALTEVFWHEWNSFNKYNGAHSNVVRRSAVTLKLLTYSPTGAFVAAPTTSLPESPGGCANWDYRFAWIRDTGLFINTFYRLGYSGEAKEFFRFITSHCHRRLRLQGSPGRPDAQGANLLSVLYPIHPFTSTDEEHLLHWRGYADSLPIRIGNNTNHQFQLDTYGYLLDTFFFFKQAGGRLSPKHRRLIEAAAQDLVHRCREPDNGIWELPHPSHRSASKIMAWSALRRAAALLPRQSKQFETIAAELRQEIMANGLRQSPQGPYFSESFDNDEIDASSLLAFSKGFIDAEMARSVRKTVERRLAAGSSGGPFLFRNSGLQPEPKEGAFILCSFWWIDHLLQEGDVAQAERLLNQVLDHLSPLGLLAEEIDPATGAFLGNFPQGFSHLGLITAILNLHEAKRNPDFIGKTEPERFLSTISRTVGFRGALQGFIHSPSTIRLLFSKRSKWPRK